MKSTVIGTIFVVLTGMTLAGCIFAPTKYGSRGFVGPDQAQYQFYLANCSSFSPRLREACRLRGNPDVIQIGYSAGIFGWRDPVYLLRIGSFGYTSEISKIPSKWKPYLTGQWDSGTQLKKSEEKVVAHLSEMQSVPKEPHVQIKTLNYNPHTRKGCITVEFDSGCYAEARLWARGNIETLARDKNVALQTGIIPAAAKFYLGAERVKEGNILEIEFETE